MAATPNEDRLLDLLVQWDELRRQGREVTPESLCAECPELVEELRRRIAGFRNVDLALDTRTPEIPSTSEHPESCVAVGGRNGPGFMQALATYRPERHHAQGGLGEVLAARELELNRQVALKRIRPDKLHEAARRRFLREAAITAGLQHPGIVPIYGLGQDEDGPFYTMPFVRGQTLQEAIGGFHQDPSLGRDWGQRSLKFRGLLQQFTTVCNTMAYAHDQGVVHRDLKPSNIMLGPYGETLVMDWGLAKAFGADDQDAEGEEPAPSPSPSPEALTATGDVLGTPQYMSPEQAKGEPAGPASDIFSLGLILYAILTGKPAYNKGNLGVAELLKAAREAAGPAASSEGSAPAPRAGGDLPEGAGRAPGGPIRHGPRPGQRCRELAGRRAGESLARAVLQSCAALDAPPSHADGEHGDGAGAGPGRSGGLHVRGCEQEP
jgi:tRNA A-37 threonylcarbamoyl transferase component Bud32